MSADDVITAWDKADPTAIHPLRGVSEEAYWSSGQNQAAILSTVLPAGCKVIDYGCGDGRVAIPLRGLGYDVTAADSSQAMLDRLTERDPDMPTLLSRGTDLAEQYGKKADAVVSLAVLIHHSYADCLDLIAQMRATVNGRNGLLVLDWPVSEQPTEAAHWIGVTTWSLEAQAEACQRIGLKPVPDTRLPWGVYKAAKAG
jgi:2-polyprenyl-3-methyl-5-hydroxy-6-metoxy-1,4-benzoquinol methylase